MRFKILLLLVFVWIDVSSVIAQDKKLEIVGTVVGKDRLFGHIYDSNAVNKRLLIVRVDEKIKGKIDSKFILVDYLWRLKDKNTPYDDNKATQWKFIMTRQKSCDSALEKLQYSYFSIDGKITGMFPQIDRTRGIDFQNLPFEETLPCYKLEPEDFSKINSFVIDSGMFPRTDTEFFVIKDSFIINLPQTPLEIRISFNGMFEFTNTSDKTITNYTLGCVIKKGSEIIVTDKANPENEILQVNISLMTPRGSGGMPDRTEQIKTCYDKNSKFSVVEVGFEDKSIWQAK